MVHIYVKTQNIKQEDYKHKGYLCSFSDMSNKATLLSVSIRNLITTKFQEFQKVLLKYPRGHIDPPHLYHSPSSTCTLSLPLLQLRFNSIPSCREVKQFLFFLGARIFLIHLVLLSLKISDYLRGHVNNFFPPKYSDLFLKEIISLLPQ